jgi:hypothetical protein
VSPKNDWIELPNIWLLGPPTSSGAMNSPVVGMSTNTKPETTPGRLSGRTTRKNVVMRPAPRSCAAATRLRSMLSSTTKMGSATKGTHA